MKTLLKGKFKVDFTDYPDFSTATYLLMPFVENFEPSVNSWCATAKTNIAVISGMDWDDDLTPWPAPGVPKGCEPFKGKAPEFLEELETMVIPEVEKQLPAVNQRNLIGVSLSGLFALWAWMRDGYFKNICSLSGSFWYEGFVEWLKSYNIPAKNGGAFFELGRLEPESHNKIFATVGKCTADVIKIIHERGIETAFQWVPGNHYSPIVPRLDLAFKALAEYGRNN